MTKRVIVVLVLIFSQYSFSQKTNSSPYSFFGIGDGIQSKSVREISMGGIGVAMDSWRNVNLINPASNSYYGRTIFSIAATNNFRVLKDFNTQEQTSTLSFSYGAIGVPVGKRGGLTFGLRPNTSVGYDLNNTVLDPSQNLFSSTFYSGTGGSSNLFIGGGYRIYKGLSVGFEGQYVFGNLDNSIIYQQQGINLATKYETKSRLSGNIAKLGIHYKDTIYKNIEFTSGIAMTLENNLRTKGDEYLFSLQYANGLEFPRDTVENSKITGNYKNPLKTVIGVGVGKTNKWYAGANYTFQKAIEFTGTQSRNNAKVNYTNSSIFSLGGFYIPKINSISSYWQRVEYRLGMKAEDTGIQIRNSSVNTGEYTALKDFGMSFGVGLPVGKHFSSISLGFDLGKRGTTKNNLIEENYYNVRIGLSLSDKWFNKRRID